MRTVSLRGAERPSRDGLIELEPGLVVPFATTERLQTLAPTLRWMIQAAWQAQSPRLLRALSRSKTKASQLRGGATSPAEGSAKV